MLLKNCDFCGKKEKAGLNYISNIFLDYCFRNDSINTGIFVSELSAPRSRESSMVLFYENVRLRVEMLKDTLNINHELQFEMMNYVTSPATKVATTASEHPHLKNLANTPC